jgi:uncharacterized damage-inducible protein DinB
MPEELGDYTSRAARALVLLHEKHLRQCLVVWQQAKAVNLPLPATDDANYASLETLLRHILGAPGGYLRWICKQLELPDPSLDPVPEADDIEQEAQAYLDHLLTRWRLPLAGVTDKQLVYPEYPSNGGTHHHCIDIMLQHAVMHTVRHQFQLEELLSERSRQD